MVLAFGSKPSEAAATRSISTQAPEAPVEKPAAAPASRIVQFTYSASLHQTLTTRLAAIAQKVEFGRLRASKLKVVLGGLVRDAEHGLPNSFRAIESIVRPFADHRIVVVEGDSADKTKTLLAEWSKNDTQRRIAIYRDEGSKRSYAGPDNTGLERMYRMARVRNALRQEIVNASESFKPDLVILWDLDLGRSCLEPLDVDMVHASLGRPEVINGKVDLACSQSLRRYAGNAELGYHDTFAMRFPGQENVSGRLRPEEYNPTMHDFPDIPKTVMQGDNLRPVLSCFGGIALYKPAALRMCEYEADVPDCEHVTFHACMREKGMRGIFIDPLMTIRYDSVNIEGSTGECLMCPSKEHVLDTPLDQRWGKWDWGGRPLPAEELQCKLDPCGDPTTDIATNRVPCYVKGMPARKCVCIQLPEGTEVTGEKNGCKCPPV